MKVNHIANSINTTASSATLKKRSKDANAMKLKKTSKPLMSTNENNLVLEMTLWMMTKKPGIKEKEN